LVTVAIKGKRVKRGADYGVELPCEFNIQGEFFLQLVQRQIKERKV
jgi:hypothetical protein